MSRLASRQDPAGVGTGAAVAGGLAGLVVCPRCREALAPGPSWRCRGCDARYPTLDGVVDLRVPGASRSDQADLGIARELAAAGPGVGFEELVERLWRLRGSPEARDPALARRRLGQIRAAPGRHLRHAQARGGLRPGSRVLDLGTGPGGALVAAAGARCVGVDLSLAWLVVARRRLAGLGLDALLVAADACRLPVASGAFDLVLAFDLLEHVQDPRAMLGEACRVLSPEGRVVATTPNRLSLGPDPHHGLWGVGWLPRRLGRRWVAWRLGRPERFVTSESRRAIRRLAGRAGEIRIEHPPIPSEDLALFAPGKRALARLYNGLLALPGVSLALGPVAPFYRVTVRPAHGDGAAGDAEAARARRPGGES